jgi:cytochrome P450 family 110
MTMPDGPKTFPLLQMLHFVTDPLGYLDKCDRQYPDIFSAPVGITGLKPTVYVSHPQGNQQLLTRDIKEFEAPGWVNRILLPLVGEQSILMLDGETHRRMRQLLLPSFHGEQMRNHGKVICNIAREVSSQWKAGETFIAFNSMQKISLGVILREVFGLYEGARYEKLENLISSVLERFSSPLGTALLFFPSLQRDLGPWSPWGRFLQEQRQIDELLYTEIEQRRSDPDPNRTDILSLMMSARDEKGEPMTDLELHDELISLLIGGHDTTATAMSWALYWIHKLPQVREKLLQELATLGENPDPMEIFRLPYLSAVCSETLRMYPMTIHTLPRQVKSPVELMGYQLSPGTIVVSLIYLTHQREDIYPEPKQFKPERFLAKQFSPYEYLPFGGGARRCIGMELAKFEMKLVLATILSDWEIKLADNRPVRPVRRWVTLGPAGGVKIVAIAHR